MRRNLSIFVFIVAACVGNATFGDVIFVNASARVTKASDGTSWERAFRDLQDALEVAQAGDEIWVAAGVYKPSRLTDPNDPLTATFNLLSGVSLYGGFAGWEWEREQRDPRENKTIFSGDHQDDDAPVVTPTSDCCLDVAEPTCSDEDCRSKVIAAIPGCAFLWRHSSCLDMVQVLCCDLCRPTRCDNSYHVLTAMYVENAVYDGFTISYGEAKNIPGQHQVGGGLLVGYSRLTVNNCVFGSNRSQGGSGIFDYFSELAITHCTFSNNGYGALDSIDSDVLNCEFVGNFGGGLIHGGSGRIWNNRFIGNSENYALLLVDQPSVYGCTFIGNTGGAVSLLAGFGTISNCRFLANFGVSPTASNHGIMVMHNCVFSGNVAASQNTATFHNQYNSGPAYLFNTVFVNNSRGIYVEEHSTLFLENCVVWNNGPPNVFSTLYQVFAQHFAVGEVRYSNVQYGGHSLGDWWDLPRVAPISVDPKFVDADGPDNMPGTEDDDFHLLPDSPMIDAGDPEDDDLHRFDADGHARIICGRADIGAFEFGIGDYNCDRVVELPDLAGWQACESGPIRQTLSADCKAFDFNADNDVDLWDFAGFQRVLAGE